MTNQVLIATSPDDTLVDGFRILAIDLDIEQSKILSDSLLETNLSETVVLYNWKITDDINWLLDKKIKSNLIIFNADSQDQTVVGYMAAQKNAYYLGTLKSLSKINNRAIYSRGDLNTLLNQNINQYE
jgi:hypothetical protein